MEPPPCVVLLMPEHWPRSLLGAELLERGLDPVGAPDAAWILTHPVEQPGRGPVRVVLVDQALTEGERRRLLDLVLRRWRGARTVLLARTTVAPPAGPWDAVVRRPASIAEIVAVVVGLVSPPGGTGVERSRGRGAP